MPSDRILAGTLWAAASRGGAMNLELSRPTKLAYGVGATSVGIKNTVFHIFVFLYFSQVLGLQPYAAHDDTGFEWEDSLKRRRWLYIAVWLLLSACASAPPAPEEAPPPMDDYARIAIALLGEAEGALLEPEGRGEGLLSSIDHATTVTIVAGAFETKFSESEAALIADFLESAAGQAGVSSFSTWLFRGQFLTSPLPQGLPAAWDTFRETATGIKMFGELWSLYREVSFAAIRLGGAVVTRAIAADIGEENAAAIIGALMKSGGSFF
jgi:hypothetical protein